MDPVIIVGAGPVGLTLALALARQEVPSVVLDDGPGKDEPRLARTAVLREDTTALVERLTGAPLTGAGVRWSGWRSMRRRQVMRRAVFDGAGEDASDGGYGGGYGGALDGRRGGAFGDADDAQDGPAEDSPSPGGGSRRTRSPAPRPARPDRHPAGGARPGAAGEGGGGGRLDGVEQDASGVTAHTRGPKGTWWRGSYLVGCDGPRSTVRKLQDIRFPGRTAVERYAVAALRTELPWSGEALLHRLPPWRTAGPSAA